MLILFIIQLTITPRVLGLYNVIAEVWMVLKSVYFLAVSDEHTVDSTGSTV